MLDRIASGVQRVTNPASPLFRPSIKIIQESIAANEQLSADRLLRLLENDDYRLYCLVSEGHVAAAAFLYLPRDEGFGHLDYMAVRSDLRNQGVGARLFRALVDVVSDERPGADYLLLEVDDDRRGDSAGQLIARRRIEFYRRLGAKVLTNVHYLFPSHNGPPVPMRLMAYEFHQGTPISRGAIASALGAIFTVVHDRGADDPLLASTIRALPSTAILE
jgi:ribosomal protein S18 acetylase RimI-like enzyme